MYHGIRMYCTTGCRCPKCVNAFDKHIEARRARQRTNSAVVSPNGIRFTITSQTADTVTIPIGVKVMKLACRKVPAHGKAPVGS